MKVRGRAYHVIGVTVSGGVLLQGAQGRLVLRVRGQQLGLQLFAVRARLAQLRHWVVLRLVEAVLRRCTPYSQLSLGAQQHIMRGYQSGCCPGAISYMEDRPTVLSNASKTQLQTDDHLTCFSTGHGMPLLESINLLHQGRSSDNYRQSLKGYR